MTLRQIEKIFLPNKEWSVGDVLDKFAEKEPLGEGAFRTVYAFRENRNYVIKIERDMSTGTFANVSEWRNWINFRYSRYEKWLAPCMLISENGNVLIQRRAKPLQKSDLPKKIPPFFTDKKIQNWGRIGNKVVCIDYAYILPDQGKMKRVYWK